MSPTRMSCQPRASMRWFLSARSVAPMSGAPRIALSRWSFLKMVSSDMAFCAAGADRGALLARGVRLDLALSISPGGMPRREEFLGPPARGLRSQFSCYGSEGGVGRGPQIRSSCIKLSPPLFVSIRICFSVPSLPLISLAPLQFPVALSFHPPHLHLSSPLPPVRDAPFLRPFSVWLRSFRPPPCSPHSPLRVCSGLANAGNNFVATFAFLGLGVVHL